MKVSTFATLSLLFCAAFCVASVSAAGSSRDVIDLVQPELVREVSGVRVGLKTDDEVVQREEEQMSHTGFSTKERKLIEETAEKYEFQAEVNRLMDIIINSLYSKKEIFLRELISNASDALDKIRFQSLTDKDALGEGDCSKLEIRISADKEAGTITISDSGIGMTKDDLIQNLGTIAKSGTSKFLEEAAKGGDVNLIGQFGVGFYSVYLVADKVTVSSKNNNDPHRWIWESQADSTFSISEDPRESRQCRGTDITLHLKEDAQEFMEEDTIRDLIKRYSEFINFPIYLETTKEVEVEVEDEEAEKEEAAEDEEVTEETEEKEKPKKTIKEERKEMELVNNVKAIWTRSPSEISDEEYDNFYKALSKDTDAPLAKIHFTAEGEIEFRSILYIPSSAPPSLYDNNNAKMDNIKLYVRRVFITDEFEDLLPRYLSFIRGVVDSEDLPLNVSREMLQQSRILKVIRKKLVAKTLEMLRKMADAEEKAKEAEEEEEAAEEEEEEEEEADTEEEQEEEEEHGSNDYSSFFKEFGKSIKLGIIEDSKNRKKLAKLLRFISSASASDNAEDMTSLATYVKRMKEGQKHIYYICGSSLDEVKKSPMLEKLRQRDYEVLYLTEPIDEYAMQHLDEFEDHKVVDVSKEELKFGDEKEKREKKLLKDQQEKLKPLTEFLKEELSDSVEKVIVSNRLTETPCVIVTSQYGWSANLEKLMKAQALADPSKYNFMASKKIMEINPRHAIVDRLFKLVEAGDEESIEMAKRTAHVLYDSAVVGSGFEINEPSKYTARVNELLSLHLGMEAKPALLPEEPLPELDASDEATAAAEEEDVFEVEDPNAPEETEDVSATNDKDEL